MNETSPPIELPLPGPAQEQRISTLVGDRLCIRCAYNLVGQPVLREAHYNMLIVRCPECATVASLQEHPLLGRWATRWAVVLAGLWVMILLAGWLLTSFILYGLSVSTAIKATEPYAEHIAQLQTKWIEQGGIGGDQVPYWSQFRGQDAYYTQLLPDWWDTQDPAALLAEAGGWVRVADWKALLTLVRWSPGAIAMGCVWALMLPHIRRRWLPVASLPLIALAGVFGLLGHADPFAMSWVWSVGENVFPQVGLKVLFVALLLVALPLTVGLLLGRTLARLLVRGILPPRLRSSLSSLWLIDSLQPPAGAPVRRSHVA